MYTTVNHHLKNNVAACLLVSMLAISMMSMGMVFLNVQMGAKMVPSLSAIEKISISLLDEIMLQGEEYIDILVETFEPSYTPIKADIAKLGGSVRFEYKYINALAANLPKDKILMLASNENVKKIYLDAIRFPLLNSPLMSKPLVDGTGFGFTPVNKNVFDERKHYNPEDPGKGHIPEVDYNVPLDDLLTISLTPEQMMLIDPTTYWNPVAMGAYDVWATGCYGQGTLVVIIDTGVWANHFMLYPNVIGGVDLSPDVGTDHEGWNRTDNHWHGTHVAGILAGHGAILVHASHPLYRSISMYATPPPEASSLGYPGYYIIPLTGMAPLAQIFAIKVFPHTGAGVPESYIIDAIEYAIDMKLGGVDVDLISMSLGGPTLFDGRDLEDVLVDYATSVNITVVSAAGNEGPVAMTVSSPGSAETGITVGAAAHPINTRVFWDYYWGQQGIGWSLFVSDTPQVHALSSRGPTSDGRDKPDVVATGIFVLSAYHEAEAPQALAFASGTSMSTPAVSGGVALLNSYAEAIHGVDVASPEDYKQAIKGGAVWLSGYDNYDQGAGYLNAANALSVLIEDDSLGDVAPPLPETYSLMDITNIPIVESGEYADSIVNLKPGFKRDYVFEVTEATDSIVLEITNVRKNIRDPFGLNSFEIYIQSAKRTTYGYYIDSANVWGNAKFVITDDETKWYGRVSGVFMDPYTRLTVIEPGYVKIAIENDWTSSGPLSCDIKITVTETVPKEANETYSGTVEHDGWVRVPASGYVLPPPGTTKVVLELWWESDWTTYPTSDLDMYVCWYNGTTWIWETLYEGATLNSPERVTIEASSIGEIYIYIHGYAVYTDVSEPWTLKVYYN